MAPFPAPRVEVSALGEAAVIEGALAAGVDAALERVFRGASPACFLSLGVRVYFVLGLITRPY